MCVISHLCYSMENYNMDAIINYPKNTPSQDKIKMILFDVTKIKKIIFLIIKFNYLLTLRIKIKSILFFVHFYLFLGYNLYSAG